MEVRRPEADQIHERRPGPEAMHAHDPGAAAVTMPQNPGRGGAVGLERQPPVGSGNSEVRFVAARPPQPFVCLTERPPAGDRRLEERGWRLVVRRRVIDPSALGEQCVGACELVADSLVVGAAGESAGSDGEGHDRLVHDHVTDEPGGESVVRNARHILAQNFPDHVSGGSGAGQCEPGERLTGQALLDLTRRGGDALCEGGDRPPPRPARGSDVVVWRLGLGDFDGNHEFLHWRQEFEGAAHPVDSASRSAVRVHGSGSDAEHPSTDTYIVST